MNRQVAKAAKKYLDEPDRELDRLAHETIGAALDVHRILGPGLLESVYEEALCVELPLRRIPFARQVPLSVDYKHQRIGEARLDLLVGQRLIVELKAVESIVPVHVAQVLSYLKLGGFRLGILINFNVPELRRGIKRCINSSCSLGALGGLAVRTTGPNLPESIALETSARTSRTPSPCAAAAAPRPSPRAPKSTALANREPGRLKLLSRRQERQVLWLSPCSAQFILLLLGGLGDLGLTSLASSL